MVIIQALPCIAPAYPSQRPTTPATTHLHVDHDPSGRRAPQRLSGGDVGDHKVTLRRQLAVLLEPGLDLNQVAPAQSRTTGRAGGWVRRAAPCLRLVSLPCPTLTASKLSPHALAGCQWAHPARASGGTAPVPACASQAFPPAVLPLNEPRISLPAVQEPTSGGSAPFGAACASSQR